MEATYSWTPTVPVMHLKGAGHGVTAYGIANGMALLARLGAHAMIQVLHMVTGDLVLGNGEQGALDKDIKLTFQSTAGAFQL